MVWQQTTKHMTPAYVPVAVGETGQWSFDMTANLNGGSLGEATVSLIQIDPATLATIAGFATSSPIESGDDITFNWTGAVLTRGRTYELQIRYVASANSTPVTLLTIGCIA